VAANKRFVKIFTPPVMCPREVFAKIARHARDFQFSNDLFFILNINYSKWFTGGFFLPSATNVFNFSIGTILQWSTLGYCNLNTHENEEVAFIGQRSGEPLKWRQFDEISKPDTISKIKYTALFQNLVEIFFSHFSLCESTTTVWYFRDSAIKSKQDGKIWLCL
jgi:hypothetical protein